MQPPVHEAEALASPSAPAHDAPPKQVRRRLPASLQRGSTRLPSVLSTPGNLQAVLIKESVHTMLKTLNVNFPWKQL